MEDKPVLRNINEEVVDLHIMSLIQNIDVCDCPICVADIKAIALNDLAPRYATSVKGEVMLLFMASSDQGIVDVQSAIQNAAVKVAANPRHKRQPRGILDGGGI